MSSKNLARIKQIRPYDGGNFNTHYPIGTDGLLVDMLSGLDLEEEFLIGPNHYVNINEDENITVIKQWYFSKPKGNKTLAQMVENTTYTVQVMIETNTIENYIIDDQDTPEYIITDNNNTEDQSDDTILVQRIGQSKYDGNAIITTTLYKGFHNNGEGGTLIHSKKITITDNSEMETTVVNVDEQLIESTQTEEQDTQNESGQG